MANASELISKASEQHKKNKNDEAVNIYLRAIKFFPWTNEAIEAQKQIKAILEKSQGAVKIDSDVEETFLSLDLDVSLAKGIAVFDAKKKAEEAAAAQAERNKELAKQLSSLMVTTGFSFEGYKIDKYIDIISGETVLGTGMFSEIGATIADVTGTSSGLFSGKLSTAKAKAFAAMKENCVLKGGNAIIGVDFDYITFANNMIGVVANGTAVHIVKDTADGE